jgi:hypothetical protein
MSSLLLFLAVLATAVVVSANSDHRHARNTVPLQTYTPFVPSSASDAPRILAYDAKHDITPYESVRGLPYSVTYDERSILINGQRTLLLSGSIHYPRASPTMWPQLMASARTAGLNTIQTYESTAGRALPTPCTAQLAAAS